MSYDQPKTVDDLSTHELERNVACGTFAHGPLSRKEADILRVLLDVVDKFRTVRRRLETRLGILPGLSEERSWVASLLRDMGVEP